MAGKDVVKNKKKVIGNNTHVQKIYWMLQFSYVNSLRDGFDVVFKFFGKIAINFLENEHN